MPRKNHGENPEEHKEKRRGKKGGRFFLLLILFILLVILWLLNHFKIGFGGDGDNGKSGSNSTTVSDQQTTENVNSAKTVEVKVSGDKYYIDDNESEFDSIISDFITDENIVVTIIDDNASVNAMEALHKVLKENKIDFSESFHTEDMTEKNE